MYKQYKSINNLIRTSAHLLICTLIFSCAQVVAPGGGPKDKTPPQVRHYSPDSAQLNFRAKDIEIDFNEYIQLRDLNTQLIISPPMEKMPEISSKKKTLKIEFDPTDTLKANTTYCLSFGNSIQDLNEGNPVENFKYIFSTGTFIDSLVLKGKVQNSFDHNTEKGIVVALYNELFDSVVYKKQPIYFSKTEADGTFQINNIRSGKYKLIAFKDANANFKYDGDSESIGFTDSIIDVNKPQTVLINMFQEPSKIIYFKKFIHDSYGKISLIFNQGSDSLRAVSLNGEVKSILTLTEFSKNKDTLTYWINNVLNDSLLLQINNGNKILDTILLKLIPKEDALKSKKNPLKLDVVGSPNGNSAFNLNSKFVIKFNHPIRIYNSKQIMLKEDTVLFQGKKYKLVFDVENEVVLLSKIDTTQVGIKNKSPFIDWKENTNYQVLIPPGTFIDMFGLSNDSIKIDFKTQQESYYGSVKLNLKVPATIGEYIVQLLDENEKVIREDFIEKSVALNYEYLAPRKYKLKIIYDDNKNKKWDTGNYLLKIQPEKVIYNSELITIRSNWDIELDWEIIGTK